MTVKLYKPSKFIFVDYVDTKQHISFLISSFLSMPLAINWKKVAGKITFLTKRLLFVSREVESEVGKVPLAKATNQKNISSNIDLVWVNLAVIIKNLDHLSLPYKNRWLKKQKKLAWTTNDEIKDFIFEISFPTINLWI